jgi:hypothetical protein
MAPCCRWSNRPSFTPLRIVVIAPPDRVAEAAN